jgi:hypothetical protein
MDAFVKLKTALTVLGTWILPACGSGEPTAWEPVEAMPSSSNGVTWPASPQGSTQGTTQLPNTGVPDASGPNVTPKPTASTGTPGVSPGMAPVELLARTWRLSHDQYRRSIRQLFDVDVDMTNFAPETGNGTFVNFSSTAFVRQDLAANYLSTAKKVVRELDASKLAALTSCNLSATCSTAFIEELGRRVFRRPVPEEVVARYQGIIDTATASTQAGALEAGYRAVVIAMLNSPLFLYRTEVGPEEGKGQTRFELTDHELATLLSFSLLGTAPPSWLEELADAGALRDRGPLPSTVRRLLTEPGANVELARFLEEWLEIHDFGQTEKSDVFPGFEAAKPLLFEEFAAFVAEHGQQDNTLVDLLVGDIPEVSPRLTEYYYSDPSAPMDRTQIRRAGVLGLGIVLADHAKSYLTSPTLRGTFVRKRFFCQEITLPPDFTPPPLSITEAQRTARTTRELYEQHQADPTCAPCHDLTDNIGFVMEQFDGAGRVRTRDTTQGADEPLDLTAELTASDVNRVIDSLDDLNLALSESDIVRQCLARQAFRYYFGQGERSAQLPPIQKGATAVAGSTLGALLEGLFTTESTFVRVREHAR